MLGLIPNVAISYGLITIKNASLSSRSASFSSSITLLRYIHSIQSAFLTVSVTSFSAIKNELLENDEEDDGNRSAAKLDIPEGVEVFDVKGPFFFGAVEQFKDQVLETLEHDTKVVILRMRLVPALDATGLNVLSDFCHQCREHGSTLLVCGVQPQPLDVIRHAPFYRELKRYNICENIDAALNRARKIINGPALKHL